MIYLDNAATSWPKPDCVNKAMQRAMTDFGSNPGRGVHQGSLGATRLVNRSRELLAELFKIKHPERFIFTHNATHALNLGIKGALKQGDHVITSSMEHNSVWRPLKHMAGSGIELDTAKCEPDGTLLVENIEYLIKQNTKMIVITHASNVTGSVMPVEQIGKIARKHGVLFMVDASQTAGVIDIDAGKLNIDLLAFPGHKGLFGPQGTGGLYIAPNIDLEPLIHGGTGSNSELEIQPDMLPERYESGTLNVVGIAGLGAAVEFILSIGTEEIQQKELSLRSKLISGLANIPQTKIYGPINRCETVSVVSINIGEHDSNEIGCILDQNYNIIVRTGLHCAPKAHETIKTLEQGTIRFSPSYFTTEADIENAVIACTEIQKGL